MNKDWLSFFYFNNLWVWHAAHVRSIQLQRSGDEPEDKCAKNRLSVAFSYYVLVMSQRTSELF